MSCLYITNIYSIFSDRILIFYPWFDIFTICSYNHSFSLMQKVSKTFLFMAHNYVYHISITVQNDEMQDCTFHCIHSGPQLTILHKSLHNWRSTFSKLQIEIWKLRRFIDLLAAWFDLIPSSLLKSIIKCN